MFQKINKTQFPPQEKPVMVWDGDCGFCKYWVTRWQSITQEAVQFAPYQSVASQFGDIGVSHFRQASRLIETDGSIYSGPRSAYRSLAIAGRWKRLDRWYARKGIFMTISDKLYDVIARHRSFFFKVTKALFGSDPHNPRPFWIIYLGVVLYFIYILA